MYDKRIHVDYAKFLQNILLEHNYKCYLVGGALISSIRDNGVLKEMEDIDFAIIDDSNNATIFLDKILNILDKNSTTFSWRLCNSLLKVKYNTDENYCIDLFPFVKRNLNYYLNDIEWIHERIFSFQTFLDQDVFLENRQFKTMYRPDLFLRTVYGDYTEKKDGYAVSTANTVHMKTCFFYTSEDNYDKIDYQVENLKIFFNKVNVCRSMGLIDSTQINIFDDLFSTINADNILVYSQFINFLIKNDINYLKV